MRRLLRHHCYLEYVARVGVPVKAKVYAGRSASALAQLGAPQRRAPDKKTQFSGTAIAAYSSR